MLAGLLYIIYIALEPWVRRLWPQTMVGWSRLITGHPRDPKVGSDCLAGAVWGVGWGLMYVAHNGYFNSRGWISGTRLQTSSLSGGRFLIEAISGALTTSLQTAFVLFFIILFFKAVLRKQWIAAAAFSLLWGALSAMASLYFDVEFPYYVLVNALFVIMLVRFGLLCSIVGFFCFTLISTAPVTMDLSAWYSSASLFPMLIVLAIAAYGFHTTMGGRSILKAELQ